MQTVGEIVRKEEQEYRRGSVQKSKYVNFSMYETLSKADAYINSTHTSGETDSLGREKPFFNIVTATTNIWFRAIDIDTKSIKFRSNSSKQWLNTIIAKILVRDWMRREKFAKFLNEWGRVQSRYNSAVIKGIENTTGLHLAVIPWDKHICDAVEYEPNPKIDILELTEGQLRRRIQTHGYNKDVVESLVTAKQERQTIDHNRKDNKSDYIRLYEMHAFLSRAQLLKAQGKEKEITPADSNIFMQQIHVISYVGKKTAGGRTSTREYDDFTVYAGEENEDPYMLTHLLKEDGRTLAIGPVEGLFQAQWMVNHGKKTEKDTLDIASRLVFQTADPFFVGQNVLDNIESGDILVHAINMPLTKVDTSKVDIQVMGNFAVSWKQIGQEIAGISEAMLGITPPSGTPASLTIAMLRENYSLFETFVENRGLDVIEIMRRWVLPYIRRRVIAHSEEIGAVLDDNDITRIDAVFLKHEAIKRTNKQVLNAIEENLNNIAAGKPVQPIDATGMLQQHTAALQESLNLMGNQRFFKPSEITSVMWKDQLKDFEWDMEIDVTGEEMDAREMLSGLNQTLALIMQPGFEQNPRAKAVAGKALALIGAMSPVEFNALPAAAPVAPPMPAPPLAATPSPVPSPASAAMA